MRPAVRTILTVCIAAGLAVVSGCAGSSSVGQATDGGGAATDSAVSDSAVSGQDTASEQGPDASDRISVVASTTVWADVASQIGGDRVDTTALITDPGKDPHEFRPSGRDALAISRADVVIVNGGGYDDVLGQLLDAVGEGPVVVTAVKAAAQVPSVDPDNEHIWLDLDATAAVADRIAEVLAAVDPPHAREYTDAATTFNASLDPIRQQLAVVRDAHAGAPVLITEPLPAYLLAAAGLRNVTPPDLSEAIEEGVAVAPADMQRVFDLLADGDAVMVVYNKQALSKQAQAVIARARAAGIGVMGVSELLPAGERYQQWLREMVRALAAGLAGLPSSTGAVAG